MPKRILREENQGTRSHFVISKERACTSSISAQLGSSAFCSNLLALCQSRLRHVLQVWRWRKVPCSWSKLLLLCFHEGVLQLVLMSLSFLARISGWAGTPRSQHEASGIQLCSNIPNYKVSASALEVPKKKECKNKRDSLLRVIVESENSKGGG